MPKFWKEPYDIETARRIGIHGFEGELIIGHYYPNRDMVVYSPKEGRKVVDGRVTLFSLSDGHFRQLNDSPANRWIYYVRVCGFTFAFFTLDMLRGYIEFYSTKFRRSERGLGCIANHDLRQGTFTRLPLYLREEPKRLRVVAALKRALATFERDPENRP